MTDDDLDKYIVVRVADEIVVDLMKSACGVDPTPARISDAPPRIHVTPVDIGTTTTRSCVTTVPAYASPIAAGIITIPL